MQNSIFSYSCRSNHGPRILGIHLYKCPGNTFFRAFPRDILYVVCSRANSAADLSILTKNNRFTSPKALGLENRDNDIRVELQKEPARYLDLQFATLSRRTDARIRIQLISHNVQIVRAHIDQIVNDPTYTSLKLFYSTRRGP